MADAADRIFTRAVESHRAGNAPEAMALCRKALKMAPAHADALNLLGVTYLQRSDYDSGMPFIRRALAIAPRHAEAHNNLGNALQAVGRAEEALDCYRKALACRPDYASAHNNMGNVLKDLKRHGEARACYERSLAINPGFAEAHNNLGNSFYDQGRAQEALACYEQAVAAKPGYADAHSNLGNALREFNRTQDALACYERALALQPGFAEARWNRSHTLLSQGRLREGWTDYELRWSRQGKKQLPPSPLPCWLGETRISGRRLLIQSEQGLGDAIQMLRYVQVLQGHGVECWLQAQPPLARLAARSLPHSHVIGEDVHPPQLHCRIPLMSLPLALGTFSEQAIPRLSPYLHADAARAAHWRERLAQQAPRSGLSVGLAWRGNPEHRNDHQRSARLEDIVPLIARHPSVRFVTLQKSLTEAENGVLQTLPNVCALDAELADLDDTAAVMVNLDAVVSVDSAPAHLAAALGRPTWILLPFSAEWRWLIGREDSPWYPTARLFRQRERGHWAGPLERVSSELAQRGAAAPVPV